MRLKRSREKILYLFNRTAAKDTEGNTTEQWPEQGIPLLGEWWPGGGKLQAELYGERLKYIRNVRIDSPYTVATEENGHVSYRLQNGTVLREGDAFGLDTDTVQYRIIAVKPDRFLRIEAEAMIK